MTRLSASINQVWPEEALNLIKAKGLSVKKLQHKFKHIYFPWDLGYNNFRFFYKLQIQELPLFVVSAINNRDIENFLNLIYKKKLSVRVINGRHSSNVQNPDVYLNISELDHISLRKNVLSVGGGVHQGSIYEYLNKKNSNYHYIHGTRIVRSLANNIGRHLENNLNTSLTDVFSGGTAGSVGVSGITSCGGIGTFKRTYGLVVDSVKSFEIVVPPSNECKAQTLKVDSKHNSNLFWGLLGGLCSNFGVITNIKYVLPTIDKVIMYSVTFPWNQASSVLSLWLDTAPSRPNEFNEDIGLNAVGQNLGIEVGGIYVIPDGQSIEEAEIIILEQLDSLILLDGTYKSKVSTYYDTVNTLSERRIYQPFSATRIFMSSNKIDPDYIISQLELAQNLPGTYIFSIDLLGGRISQRSSDETAYYPRSANYFYDIFTFSTNSLDVDTITTWASETFETIYQPVQDTVFVGFQIPGLPNHLHAYYGNNSERLIEVKNEYDPNGVMDFPQGIPNIR